MGADCDFVLIFPAAREAEVLDALRAHAATPGEGWPAKLDGIGLTLELPITPELEAIGRRHQSVGLAIHDGRATLGEIVVHHRVTKTPFGGTAQAPAFELTLWPVTSRLWEICRNSTDVRALLVHLLAAHGGLEGWVDRGNGSGERFWPPA